MNNDPTTLASAYLDGAVTPDERALVESNPELLAEVEQQRLVRALLADVDKPAISLREEHLAAALGTWDRLPQTERVAALRDNTPSGVDPATAAAAATISTPPPTSLAERRRSQSTTWMIGVAAALALVLAGGVVLQSLPSRSSNDSSSGDAAPAEAAPEPNSSAAIAEEAADELQRDLDSSADATADAADDSESGATEVFAQQEAAESEDDFDIDPEAPPKDADLEMLSTPEQLGIFASDALGAPVSPSLPDSSDAPPSTDSAGEDLSIAEEAIEAFEFPLCGGADYVVGPAEYRGEPVVVGIDESLNLAVAYRAIDCSVIVRASLP